MIPRSSENLLMRKTRYLTQALILSGTLNIGLVTTFVYFVLQERHASLAIELKPSKKEPDAASQRLTNAQILKAYSLLPYQELLLRLENDELIEDGLRKRDLALSCLSAFHHFHLDKALPGVLLQKRSMHFTNSEGEEKIELPVYPGLLDDQFQAILHYAKTEKWPLTAQGLFYELQRSPPLRDSSLIDTFCLSKEYEAVRTLFQKTGLPLSSEFLISLLCEGEWKTLLEFTQSQRENLDLSPDRRRAFLLSYIHHRSKSAARLLLETDLEFILKRCDDAQILLVLDLCDEKCTNLEPLAKALLASLRTDTIWKRAAETLYALAQEPLPEPYDHRLAIQRFLPLPQIEPAVVPPVVKKETQPAPAQANKKFYTVENGDSLWKISRKFHVSIEEIMRLNHLETEKLRPGKQLEIPSHNQSAEK